MSAFSPSLKMIVSVFKTLRTTTWTVWFAYRAVPVFCFNSLQIVEIRYKSRFYCHQQCQKRQTGSINAFAFSTNVLQTQQHTQSNSQSVNKPMTNSLQHTQSELMFKIKHHTYNKELPWMQILTNVMKIAVASVL